jgi:hydrogenase-4 component B
MLVAHAGAALIMLAFLLLFQKTGSFEFRLWRQAWLDPGLKSLVFALLFIGFGAKAGMAPLHFWAPGAYAAAPSQASALMAGVMKKVALYGILRLCVDLLGASTWWWGLVVLFFGALSTLIGAFYALSERDLKRLLAYSSVENVGIILLGIGVGMFGVALKQPLVAVLGLLAALYHMINHAFFKSLLFLGAGSVTDQIGTTDLNRMGGLSRRMPWTALAFIAGALAVTAIPPFNGFVSEWFTYQAFFTASQSQVFALRVLAPLCAVVLAFAGAFAVMVYIKAYGGIFSGPARSQASASAKEAHRMTVASLYYMAAGCLVLGLGSPFIAPFIASAAASLSRSPELVVANRWQVYPGDPVQAVLSTPMVFLLLLGLLVVPLGLIWAYRGWRAGRRTGVEPWSCGYGYSTNMSLPASGFDQPVRISFQPLYWVRTVMDAPLRVLGGYGKAAQNEATRLEPVIERIITRPAVRLVESAGQWIQALQMGDIRVYCLYIILTLAILLLVIFGGGAL